MKREWEGRDVTLRLHLPQGTFVIPHDTLLAWVLENKNVAETESWKSELGTYHWPSTPRDMLEFLERYRQA